MATSSSTTSAGGVDPVGATRFVSNGIDPWTRRKTVLFYKSGYVQVLDEDVAMQQIETRAPANDRFLIIARPIPGPRSKLAF